MSAIPTAFRADQLPTCAPSVPHQRLCHRGSGSHQRRRGRPSVFAGCRVTFMFLLRHLLNVLTGWRLCSGENGWESNHDKMDVFVNINESTFAVDVPHLILWWDLVLPGGCRLVFFSFSNSWRSCFSIYFPLKHFHFSYRRILWYQSFIQSSG